MREYSSISIAFLKIFPNTAALTVQHFCWPLIRYPCPSKDSESARTTPARDPTLGIFAVSIPSQRSRNQPCGALRMPWAPNLVPKQLALVRLKPRLKRRKITARPETPEGVPAFNVGSNPGGLNDVESGRPSLALTLERNAEEPGTAIFSFLINRCPERGTRTHNDFSRNGE